VVLLREDAITPFVSGAVAAGRIGPVVVQVRRYGGIIFLAKIESGSG
jgi:hypothetical protein